jgi:hypothetical protein
MKTTIASVVVLISSITLFCACGNSDKKNTMQETVVESVMEYSEVESIQDEAIETFAPGTTVSTDIVDFTLDHAELATACSNSVDENYLLPKVYDEAADADNPFVAPVGKSLVALTFTITNHDRTTLKIADSTGWQLNWNVLYNGEEWHLKGQGENDYNIIFRYAAIKEGDASWKRADTQNKHLSIGDTLTVRTYGVIDIEPEILTDPFIISVNTII